MTTDTFIESRADEEPESGEGVEGFAEGWDPAGGVSQEWMPEERLDGADYGEADAAESGYAGDGVGETGLEEWAGGEVGEDREAAEVELAEAGGPAMGEAFPSGLVLTVASGPDGPDEQYWDPNSSGLPLYDTGAAVRSKKLAANFTVGELVRSGGRFDDRARISVALVQCLQAIRDRVGRPVTITSGFRSWQRNVEVYRSADIKPTLSRHCSGQAADIKIAGMTGMQIAKLAIDACGERIGVGIGADFAHIDVRGHWAVWTYFAGARDSAAKAEIEDHRRHRSTPPPQPVPPPQPTPTPTGTDRAAGRVRRGTFAKCTGHAQPGALAMAQQWRRLTGRNAGIYNCRSTTFGTPSLHGEGRSIDLTANVAVPEQASQAETYILWLQANAVELQVAYVIWNRRQWNWASRDKGWRPYPGSNPHTDHVHVDLSWEGALTPSPLFAREVPGLGSPGPGPPDRPRTPTRKGTSALSDTFFRELKAICQRLQCDPEDLLAVMLSESDVNPAAQNPRGKATGLIQFMPKTLRGLGWTTGPDEFRKLTAEQQLPFVERYYRPHTGRLTSSGRLYQATFMPATLKDSDESTVLAGANGPRYKAYAENKGLDVNKDGLITVSDLTARINKVKGRASWKDLADRLARVA